MIRAFPLCGNRAFNRSDEPGSRFSTVEIERAKARVSPERNLSIRSWWSESKLISVKQEGTDTQYTWVAMVLKHCLWQVRIRAGSYKTKANPLHPPAHAPRAEVVPQPHPPWRHFASGLTSSR